MWPIETAGPIDIGRPSIAPENLLDPRSYNLVEI